MKRTFKTLSLLVALILVLILSACGGNISGKVTDTGNEETSSYRMGSTSGGVYSNDFLKIACELDENWVYYSDEQLAELSGITLDSIQDEDLSKGFEAASESGKIIYDMYALSSDGLASINIIFENLGVVYGAAISEEKYVDLSLDTVRKSLESIGGENITAEKTTAEFIGTTKPAIAVSCDLNGVALHELLVCMKQGSYMACITVTSANENITEQLAGLFYSIG